MPFSACLKLAGITGDSQVVHHQGEIDITSFAWDASNFSNVGTGTGVSTGKVTVSNFSITKSFDHASPMLRQKYIYSTVIPTAVTAITPAIITPSGSPK